MKKIATLVALAMGLALVWGGPTQTWAAGVVKIGAPLSLTGKFTAYGQAGKRGIDMALDVYGHTVAGMKVEVTYVDIQSNAQATVSGMTELLDKDDVGFLIGPITSGAVSWATPPWRQKKPVWIVTGSSSTKNEEGLGMEPHFFHPYPWDYDYHNSLAAALKHYLGAGRKVAIVYTDGAYGRAHNPHAERIFKAEGFNIVMDEIVREGAPDYSPALLKVRQAHPDILLGLMQTSDAVLFAKQVKSNHVQVPYLVGTVYAALDEWQKATGEAGDGWISVTSYMPNLHVPANPKYPKLLPSSDEWEKEFRARYNREPEFLDPLNYVATISLLMAIQRAGSADEDKVAAELARMDEPTFYGRLHYVHSGGTLHQAFSQMIVIQRQHGESVVVYPTDVAKGKLVPATP